mmetsp:Transcript_10989/g.25611  ORF Transcript_10989/g.25611 Transcript_10989/m.25611 type:complete len:228 (+) Transcript_10989:1518-2201(+)
MGGLCDEPELLLEVCQRGRIVFLELLEFLLEGRFFLSELGQPSEFLGAASSTGCAFTSLVFVAVFLIVLFAAPLRVREPGFGLGNLRFDFLDEFKGLPVLNLCHAVLLGPETPEIVASADLGLLDQCVVDHPLVDIRDGVGADARLGREGQDFFLGVNLLVLVVDAQDHLALLLGRHSFRSTHRDVICCRSFVRLLLRCSVLRSVRIYGVFLVLTENVARGDQRPMG